MKFTTLIFVALVFSMCKLPSNDIIRSKKSLKQNAFLPERFLVEYAPLIEKDSAFGYSLRPYQKEEFDFVDYAFNKALKGKISVYPSFSGVLHNYKNDSIPMTVEQIKFLLGMAPKTINYINEDGNEASETYASNFKPDEIDRISFIEEWNLNSSNFELTKDVLRYDFVRTYRKFDNQRYVKVFGIIANKKSTPNWDLLCSKVIEVNIGMIPCEKDEANSSSDDFIALSYNEKSYWNVYAYDNFINTMFEKLKSGKVQACDFDTKNQISYKKIVEKMGAGEETISYMNEYGDEVIKTIEREMDVSEIKSVLFFEDWYIDKNSLAIKKEIKGIAPVRFYSVDQVEETKDIVFVIWYNPPNE